MKKIKKIIASALVAALAVCGASLLTGCGEKDYSFEAENAQITVGQANQFDFSKVPPDYDWSDPNAWSIMGNPEYYSKLPVKVIVEVDNPEYTGDDDKEGPEVTNVGNFYGEGTLLTWKITSDKACDATLKLRAASAMVDNPMGPTALQEIDFSENAPVGLKVNDEDVELTGILPGIEEIEVTDYSFYRYFAATVTANIKLVAGENTIVLVAPVQQSVVNIDKIIINCKANLTYEPVDNSDFPSSPN